MNLRKANRNHRRAELKRREVYYLEDRIIGKQLSYIRALERREGQRFSTNIGWAVVEHGDGSIEYCSKIYGYGYLTTIGSPRTGRIHHYGEDL